VFYKKISCAAIDFLQLSHADCFQEGEKTSKRKQQKLSGSLMCLGIERRFCHTTLEDRDVILKKFIMAIMA